MKTLRVVQLSILLVVGLMVAPGPASATWPGTNGKIYFACRMTGGTGYGGQDICVINADGSGFANLTNSPSSTEHLPQVSRDGKLVTYTSNAAGAYHAWAMNADGSNQHQVSTIEADGPAFTPDGLISFRAKTGASSYEFQTAPAAGGPGTLLWNNGVSGNSSPPRFNAYGTFLYGKTVLIPTTTDYTQQIYTVSGGTETPVTLPQIGLNSNQQPAWSPDGSKIVFWRTTGVIDDVWVVASSGGDPVKLTSNPIPVKPGLPAYSPDGSKLVWDEYNTTDSENDFFHKYLVIANQDGSNPTPITRPAEIDYAAAPAWAPVSGSGNPATPISAFTATAPKKVKKGKSFKLALRCIGDTRCAATYSANFSVPVKGKKKKKAKSFKLKAKTLTLAAKTSESVTLKAPGKAKNPIAKALKSRKKPTIKLTITAKDPETGMPIGKKITLTVKIVT